MSVAADRSHIVIAGGGVAAVELALALHDLAGARVRMTLVSPQPQFVLRALRTAQPFAADHVRKHSLRELTDRVEADLVTDTVVAVDADRRVQGLADVYAAGDGTTYPVKQGGLACQQADVIAELLASKAGADIVPQPFRPVLRGRLLTGHHAHYPMHDEPGDHPAPELRLWSAPHKVNGRYLSPWLAELDGDTAPTASAPPDDEKHIDVDITLPTAWEIGRDAMRLDPYSPPYAG